MASHDGCALSTPPPFFFFGIHALQRRLRPRDQVGRGNRGFAGGWRWPVATGFVDGTGKVRCVTPVARTPLNTDFARRRFSIAYRTFDRLVRSWVCVPHVRPPRSFLGVRPPSSHPLGLWIRHRRRPRHRRGRHHGRPPAIVGACTEAGLRRDLDSLWGRASGCPRHEHRARHRPHRQIRYLQHGNSWAPTS